MDLQAGNSAEYVGALTGEKVSVNGGRIQVKVPANYGEVWIPAEMISESFAPIKTVEIVKAPEPVKVEVPKEEPVKAEAKMETPVAEEAPKAEAKAATKTEVTAEKVVVDWNKPYEDMTVEELQEAILEKMRKNGPVTEYMLGTVRDNTHHGSLVSWVKSFR